MLFNSLEFIFLFLPVALTGMLVLHRRLQLAWISLVSCYFYMILGQAWFLIPMCFTVVIDYFAALQIESLPDGSPRRKAWLIASLSSNLGLLFFFKYALFFAESAAFLGGKALPSWTNQYAHILPAGISFYTFQTLAYIIDVWHRRCHAEKNFLTFSSFVTFFPHLVAGPLTRHHELIPQLDEIKERGPRPRWQAGIFLFALGLCKKVLVADQIAGLIDARILNVSDQGMAGSWLLLLGYTFQIYFDFSGYSDMAIGLGRLWGVELPLNFNGPYRATNPSDFWRRWHITLSRWLRDYLYIPLGGNRVSARRRDLNMMITMLLGGLWHGASWTFVLWGFFHGALLVGYSQFAPYWNRLHLTLQRNLMFLFAVIGWLFFRAENMAHLKAWSAGLVGARGLFPANDILWSGVDGWKLLSMLALAFVGCRFLPTAHELSARNRYGVTEQVFLAVACVTAVVLMSQSAFFLYFRF